MSRQFHATAPDIPTILVRDGECVEVRLGFDATPLIIPWNLPGMSRRFGSRAALNARHWKQIHSASEALYSAFRRLHILMLLYSRDIAESGRRGASDSLDSAIGEFGRFTEACASLPSLVRDAEHLVVLRRVKKTFNALKRTLAFDPGGRERQDGIRDAIALIERICAWSFESLTRADVMLKHYFDGLEADGNDHIRS